MIMTVTMNPSVDILYPLEHLAIDSVNRCDQTNKSAGGKGLNVARVIKLMDKEVTATGILGGTIGDFIEKELENRQIPNEFLKTRHESRNCIAICHEGKQTEILETGPTLSEVEEEAFLKKFDQLVDKANLITISGSLPTGINPLIYQKMIALANKKNVRVLLDCSGSVLKKTIYAKEKPYLIKPNQTELSQLLQKECSSNPKVLKAMLSSPIFSGIQWIVVSLGADGAFIKVKDTYYTVTVPKIEAVNPVGSGDSVVAGLAVALEEKKETIEIIKTGMTTGILNTLEEKTGYIDCSKFEYYLNQIRVEKFC